MVLEEEVAAEEVDNCGLVVANGESPGKGGNVTGTKTVLAGMVVGSLAFDIHMVACSVGRLVTLMANLVVRPSTFWFGMVVGFLVWNGPAEKGLIVFCCQDRVCHLGNRPCRPYSVRN